MVVLVRLTNAGEVKGYETYVHDGNGLLAWGAEILDHVLDEHAALGDLALCEVVSMNAREVVG
jgi:hypothetical protein